MNRTRFTGNRNPLSQSPFSSCFFLGLRFTSPHNMFSTSLYSSNPHHPSSVFHKITSLDDALLLFDDMTHRRPLPSVVKFNQLLTLVTKMKHFDSSLHLFKQMCSLGVPITNISMSIAIKCCCQLCRINDGFAVLGCCFRRAIPPNVFIYSALLDGLVLQNQIVEAEMFFKKLVKQNICEPNVVMYSTMIKGLCKVSNNVTALALLRLMDQRNCKPDVVTYNTIIDSLSKDQMMDDALKLFKEMVFVKGILPNVITYNSIISGLCNLRRWDEASKMLKQMGDENISLDVHTFNILGGTVWTPIGVLPNQRNHATCLHHLITAPPPPHPATPAVDFTAPRSVMKEREKREIERRRRERCGEEGGVQTPHPTPPPHPATPGGGLHRVPVPPRTPNTAPHPPALVDAYSKEGDVKKAEAVISIMIEKGRVPNIVTYNSFIDGYCLQGEMIKASAIFDSLAFKGLLPNVVTYNSLLNGYCKNLDIEKAMQLFSEMTAKGLKPDVVSYNTMIQGLFRVGRCEVARKLFDEMHKQGLIPDQLTYGIILEGLCNNHQVEEALSLFQLVGDSKLNSHISVYTILIDGAGKCGKLDIAKLFFHDLTLKGMQPDVRIYTVMISAFCREGLLMEAKQLFLKMEESGCPPDNVTYCVLLQGYIKNKHCDDVEMLLEEMDGRGYSLDASSLELLIDEIAAGSLDRSMLKLIGNLVRKESIDT